MAEGNGPLNQIIEKGERLFASGQVNEAKRYFEAVLQEDPRSIEALNNLGVIAQYEGEGQKAISLFNQILSMDPYYRPALLNLVEVLRPRNQIRQALPHLERAYTRFPEDQALALLIREAAFGQTSSPVLPSRRQPNLRVLHGTMEIANQMHTYASGLRRYQVEAVTVCYYPNYLGYPADYSVDVRSFKDPLEANRKTREMAQRLIPRFDVFHFHYGTSLTLDKSDLPILRQEKKKVFMNYWGSEVRTYDQAVRINPYIQVKFKGNEASILKNLEATGRFVSDCIVADYELHEYVKNFFRKVHFIPQAIDLSQYPMTPPATDRLRPIVVHAPTDTHVKGSSSILKTLDKLQERFDFDLRLVVNQSHDEAKKIYQTADIIIDSILEGAYGLFALEAMALGKPVVAWICDYMRDRYPRELPIVSANPETLEEALERLLRDPEWRSELGKSGRRYVETYHDMRGVGQKLLALYQTA